MGRTSTKPTAQSKQRGRRSTALGGNSPPLVAQQGANAPQAAMAGEPSDAELAAAIYAAELEAKAEGAGVGRSARARHLLITIGQFVVQVVTFSMALSVAGLACLMFPPLELQPSGSDLSPLAMLPPLPVVQDVPFLASFVANSFDDAAEDLVKFLCLYATYGSGQLLATWVQFGVLPTAYHRDRADQLWCATAGSMTAALMYPRCNGIGDKVGDYVQSFQNYIRVEMFALPPKLSDRTRSIKYSNMYQYQPGRFGDTPAAVVVDDVVEDGFKSSCLVLHAEVGSLLGDALVLPLLPNALQKPQLLWAVSSLVTLCTLAGRYNECDAYGDALGDVVQRAVSDRLGRQIQLDHGFVVGVQTDSPWVIVSGTNPNEDEPELDPAAASSGAGAIDVYFFENIQTGELRLYGTPGLIRAQSAPSDASASRGNPDHKAETESTVSSPLGVSEERRAPGGDPTPLDMERLGTLAWDDEFYRIYFGMTIKIWQARRYAVLRAAARREVSEQYRGSGPGGTSGHGDEWALSVFNDNDKNGNGFLDPSEQAGTAFGVGRAGRVMMRFMDTNTDGRIDKDEWRNPCKLGLQTLDPDCEDGCAVRITTPQRPSTVGYARDFVPAIDNSKTSSSGGAFQSEIAAAGPAVGGATSGSAAFSKDDGKRSGSERHLPEQKKGLSSLPKGIGNSAEDIGYLHQHKETTHLLNIDGPGGVLERFAKFDFEEEAEFAQETKDREAAEEARAGLREATTGEAPAATGKGTSGTATTVASAAPVETADALHEIDELISSLIA